MAPTATPPAAVPARNRAIPDWASAATIRPSAARSRPRPASTTRRLLTRDSTTWVTVPTANKPNTTAPWTAWLPWCSTPPMKPGTRELNSPSRAKAANPATAGAVNWGRPPARADRLGNEPQAQARGGQGYQVYLEYQGGGVGRVLGEQPGDQRAEA